MESLTNEIYEEAKKVIDEVELLLIFLLQFVTHCWCACYSILIPIVCCSLEYMVFKMGPIPLHVWSSKFTLQYLLAIKNENGASFVEIFRQAGI